jgi:hypothetical protein
VVAGRQSGKTSRIAALMAVYEAFRSHGLPPGECGYVLVIAPSLKQSKIAFKFIKKYIQGSPALKSWVLKITKDEIELKNGVVIACLPCSYVAVRGYPVICVICDEMAFWSHEETAANPEQEVIDALRPAMATLHNTKLVKISTPFAKEGILWDEFQQRNELSHLVWQVSTEQMNPAVTKEFLDKARQRNEETFKREHLGEFTDSVIGWITAEILDPSIVRGRGELPQMPNVTYAAALDPASRHNDFALAILHLTSEGLIVVDRVARWAGTKTAALPFEHVLEEIKSILDEYGINTAIGDQFYFEPIRQYLWKLGIIYQGVHFTSETRLRIFGSLKSLLVQRKIELLDDPKLLRELRGLREEKTDRGQIDIRPSRGFGDDSAVAVALAAYELMKQRPNQPCVQFGIIKRDFRSRLGMIPGGCPYEAICENFPQCMDAGRCLDFKDMRA